MANGSPAPACEVRDVTVRFGSLLALDHVSIAARPGEVHAILGENGAGKSTLMNVLYGLVAPGAGEILVDGRAVSVRSPADAIALGIGMVHQHFTLVPAMTVAENVALAERGSGRRLLDRRLIEERIRELAGRYGLDVDPRARVRDLSVGTQQRVEILKSLVNEVRVLILDEPSAALAPGETRALFSVVRALREGGVAVLFITHRLDEVREISDRVTVLRRGRIAGEAGRANLDPSRLAALIVGRDLAPARERTARAAGEVSLEIQGLTVREGGRDAVRAASFQLRGGEILGIAGVDGNGQEELVGAILGARPAAGTVRFFGRDVTPLSLRARLAGGLAHIAGDRRREGLALGFTVAENMVLKKHGAPPFALRGFLRLRAIEEFALGLIARFRIAARGPRDPIENLSGGNQQKVVLARELSSDPRVVMAVHPTRGLDVASAREVHDELLALRENGRSVLLVSSDLDEVLALSDRVAVAYRGGFTEVPAGARDPETIGRLMTGGGRAPGL